MKLISRIKHFTVLVRNYLKGRVRYCLLKKEYADMARQSHIDIKSPCIGEDKYLNKWRQISSRVPIYDYRMYSKFIGNDPNIISEYVCHNIIEPVFQPKEYQPFFNDKNMYDLLFPKEWLAKSIIRSIDGTIYDTEYNILYNFTDEKLLNKCSQFDKIIVKPTKDTGNGNHILVYEKCDARFAPVKHSVQLTIKDLKSYFLSGNYVIQEFLSQHESTAQFNESSVNTFRTFVYRSVIDEQIHVIGKTFRIGKTGSVVDNGHAGGRCVGLNEDGSFASNYIMDLCGNKYTSFNGLDFSKNGFSIPNFDKVIDFSRAVGAKLLHNRIVDLDIMIDNNGDCKLVEFNVDTISPTIYQFTVGPLFGDYTDEVIDYIIKNHYRNGMCQF